MQLPITVGVDTLTPCKDSRRMYVVLLLRRINYNLLRTQLHIIRELGVNTY